MAKHYYKLAAIGGDVIARFDLGCFEKQEGNMNRALKHWHIAASVGMSILCIALEKCTPVDMQQKKTMAELYKHIQLIWMR
eukprot:scaffold802_cov39-Cyclotella_meneghiniana.AAC.2